MLESRLGRNDPEALEQENRLVERILSRTDSDSLSAWRQALMAAFSEVPFATGLNTVLGNGFILGFLAAQILFEGEKSARKETIQ